MTSAVAAVEPRNVSGRNDCRKLLADAGGSMIPTMGRDRTQQATPDQFSTASSGGPSPPTPAQEGRHVLPKELPNAFNHLNDEELDRLLTAAVAEAKRRGKSLPNAQTSRTRSGARVPPSQRPSSLSQGRLTHLMKRPSFFHVQSFPLDQGMVRYPAPLSQRAAP